MNYIRQLFLGTSLAVLTSCTDFEKTVYEDSYITEDKPIAHKIIFRDNSMGEKDVFSFRVIDNDNRLEFIYKDVDMNKKDVDSAIQNYYNTGKIPFYKITSKKLKP